MGGRATGILQGALVAPGQEGSRGGHSQGLQESETGRGSEGGFPGPPNGIRFWQARGARTPPTDRALLHTGSRVP